MAEKKLHSEHSPCALARGLDFFGDHWTLLIVRDLGMRGKHEYKELLASPEGISTNILSDRLKNMAENGLIASIPYPSDKKRKLYYLLPKGKAMIPVIFEAFKWSKEWVDGAWVPEKLLSLLSNAPERAYQSCLKSLENWEQRNGILALG